MSRILDRTCLSVTDNSDAANKSRITVSDVESFIVENLFTACCKLVVGLFLRFAASSQVASRRRIFSSACCLSLLNVGWSSLALMLFSSWTILFTALSLLACSILKSTSSSIPTALLLLLAALLWNNDVNICIC